MATFHVLLQATVFVRVPAMFPGGDERNLLIALSIRLEDDSTLRACVTWDELRSPCRSRGVPRGFSINAAPISGAEFFHSADPLSDPLYLIVNELPTVEIQARLSVAITIVEEGAHLRVAVAMCYLPDAEVIASDPLSLAETYGQRELSPEY
ncbi:hypothetical protein VTO73DRAFT_6189 [Trametes versicolor]